MYRIHIGQVSISLLVGGVRSSRNTSSNLIAANPVHWSAKLTYKFILLANNLDFMLQARLYQSGSLRFL